MPPANFQEFSNFIWSVADLLRGPYRPPQYERVMLPLTVLRRFDCVLEPTKAEVVKRFRSLEGGKVTNIDPILNKVAGNGEDLGFHNHSPLDFQRLKGDPDNIAIHLGNYIEGFSENVRNIFLKFDFHKEIEKLDEANRLYLIVSKFAEIDLHPDRVDNITMGLIFEDLIRRFNEAANETAGDHFTPREVIRLMVNLLLEPDSHMLTTQGVIATICDPACGTGGMLSEAQNWIRQHNEDARVLVYGQDYNPRSYAVAFSDLLIKGQKDGRIEFGNTLTNDMFSGEQFDYLLANPPFGVDWKVEKAEIEKQSNFRGYDGKLPRVNDGALLFLLHMLSKRQDVAPKQGKHGTRIAIVFNGSPLFTGGAGSGESEIRRWIIENDWLEAIVALPEQMFYNTGIGTFVWIVTNRKSKERKGTIQLIDVRERWAPMRRSLGNKRRYLTDEIIAGVSREHGAYKASDTCKIFDNTDFGYPRALQGVEVSLNDFAIWFWAAESGELGQYQLGSDLLAQLQEVIDKLLPGFSDLELQPDPPPRFFVKKDGNRFSLEQLSDGERGVLALAFDLTRRLAIANPESKNPVAEGKALVMIDEIELHLHPRWQRDILGRLTDTFKNCQFIVTTHSPQVVGEARPDSVFLLKDGKFSRPAQSFGMDSNWILDVLMDSDRLDPKIKVRLENVFDLIDEQKLDDASAEVL